MKTIDFIRLVRKHLVLLIVLPLLLALMVIRLTSKPHLSYTSQTVLYTGLATGSTIEMDKTFNYFLTNTAFDNLLNIINSRETQEQVAIRLLSQHLLLNGPDPKYISPASWASLKKLVPSYINKYVVRGMPVADTAASVSADSTDKLILFPASINRAAYEATVQNLNDLMKSSDSNFVYKLLNYDDPHYSIKAISAIKAQRIANSDLIKLSYEVDDPGICQQTLAIFNEVCIKNYKNIKENRSDEVVKYFEAQLKTANQQLKSAEDKLLGFNKSNNIINYYEQSKAVAVVKEDMGVDYSNKKADLAGKEAAIKRLEEKLNIQQLVQVKSNAVLEKRTQLGDLNYQIATAEADDPGGLSKDKVDGLKKKADALKAEIKKSVDDLYHYQNTTDGLPVNNVLNDWISNVIDADNLRAKLLVMDQRNRDFQRQYAEYAPAGANIKRIEREISVSEQEYLELLHGLNLAKLKLQDNELSSDLKAVDPPYYPLSPIPTKRKVLIIAAALIGFILVLTSILFMEYFDETLRNGKRASAKLGLPLLGMMPKIYLRPGITDFPGVQQRLLEMTAQEMERQLIKGTDKPKRPTTILFSSMLESEGKTMIMCNLARQLQEQGKTVTVLNAGGKTTNASIRKRWPLLQLLLGYTDPRINYNSPLFLAPEKYLAESTYHVTGADKLETEWEKFYQQSQGTPVPDYIFIELPALLSHQYPVSLVKSADLNVLICRSNRTWSEADQTALAKYSSVATTSGFILNGVEIQVVEALLGELPKKRSLLRRKLKSFFRFQFFTKSGF